MASPEREQLDAIAEALAGLIKRCDLLEGRLAKLEERAGREGALAESIQPAPPPPRPAEAPLPYRKIAPQAEPALQPESPIAGTARPARLETRMGLTWINRIGVVTLIIGVAFFFKYAVDNHWIGETGRVVLGVLAGFSTLAVAAHLSRQDQKAFAQGLFGLGIALLYVSFFASFDFYHIVPQSFAFLLMVLTTLIAALIALRNDAAAIAVLGLLGGYATPVLLSSGVDKAWIFFSYLLLLNIGAMAIGRIRQWRSIEALAFVATAILYCSWYVEWFTPEKRLVATVCGLAFYALFATLNLAPLFLIAHILTAAALAGIWGNVPAGFYLLSLELATSGLAISAIRLWDKLQLASLASFLLAYACWSHRQPAEGAIFAGLSALFLLFYGWILWRLAQQRKSAQREDLITLALNGPAYFGAGYALLHAHYSVWMGLFAIALAALHLAAGFVVWRAQPEAERDRNPALLAAGIAIAFFTLAAPIQFSGYRITLGWALEAAVLTWIATRVNGILIAAAGAVLFALTLSRLDAIDAWMYSDPNAYYTLFNARFITFVTAAIAFWLAACWTRTKILALTYYLAGHWVMLWALSLENFGWTLRHVVSNNVANVESMNLSILGALYALVLVAIGVARASGVNRMLGLVLIGLIVAKLYLYDVWQLQRLYRMGAFVALGILLLGTSYLYSRHRQTIENWWKSDAPRG